MICSWLVGCSVWNQETRQNKVVRVLEREEDWSKKGITQMVRSEDTTFIYIKELKTKSSEKKKILFLFFFCYYYHYYLSLWIFIKGIQNGKHKTIHYPWFLFLQSIIWSKRMKRIWKKKKKVRKKVLWEDGKMDNNNGTPTTSNSAVKVNWILWLIWQKERK